MVSRLLTRLVHILSAVAIVFGSSARAESLGVPIGGAAPASAFGVAGAVTSAPVFNNNQPVLTTGTTVTLVWTPPNTGSPTSYVIEASSTPAGPANLANFNTGNASTILVIPNVPPGTYYVRILALDGSGASAPSNEVQVVVGGLTSPPVLNNNQPVLTSGPTVTLVWAPPAVGSATSYVIEASSIPGGPANLASLNTGNAQTSLVIPGVPPGSYYVRIRGLNASGLGAPSNEVQVVVSNGIGTSCPSAPRSLNLVSQSGGTVTLAWLPPLTGVPTSYVVQAGSAPGGSNLANFDTNSTALALVAPSVPAGSYFVRVYARSSNCAQPTLLGPASNETLVLVGGVPGWGGQIECTIGITGPNAYRHDETQTWLVGGPPQVISSARINYPVHWSAQGSGGGVGKSWTIGATATTDLSATVVASTGIPIFDRTTTPILIVGGIVGVPTSFDLHEIDFPTIVASSANATLVSGTWSRPTVGGDSPQQPGGSLGTLTCTWSLRFQ